MKVELELSAEQLKDLDTDLTKLLSNLADKQKTKILESYIINQFDGMVTYTKDSWGRDEKHLNSFGREIVDNLRQKIVDSITPKVIEDGKLKELLDETIEKIKGDLPDIINKAICNYIVNNLFNSKEDIECSIQGKFYDLMRRQNGGY